MDEDFAPDNMTEFIESCSQTFCLWCGAAIVPNKVGRPKTFCRNKCRWDFHHHKYKAQRGDIKPHDQDG